MKSLFEQIGGTYRINITTTEKAGSNNSLLNIFQKKTNLNNSP